MTQPQEPQNEFDPSNIKLAKLSTGDSILAYLLGMDQHSMVVRQPLRIVSMQHPEQPDVINYGLMPFIEMGKTKTMVINPTHVVTIMNASDDAIKMYHDFMLQDQKAEQAKEASRERAKQANMKPKLVYQNDNHPYFTGKMSEEDGFLYSVDEEDPEIH